MSQDWRAEISRGLQNLIDIAVTGGASASEVIAEVMAELERYRSAMEHDPDPADDGSDQAIDEPANDWPAASVHPRQEE